MKVIDISLTLLKVENKSGVGKTSQKPYDFNTATVVDEDANVFKLNISDEVSTHYGAEILSFRNVPVEVSIEFRPKGFDIAGTISKLEPVG